MTAALLRLMASLMFAPAILLAHPLDHWNWRSPLPQGNELTAVACGNGLYVAVGVMGTILTSTDGTNWVQHQSGLTDDLHDCIFANNTFLAVGTLGTIITSPDGTNWTLRWSGTFYNLNAITYGNGTWVAVGNANTILTSSDAALWVSRTVGPFHLYDVAFGNGTFVASGVITLTSTNGISWGRPSSPDNPRFDTVAFGGGKFLAEASGNLWTSANGNVWQSQAPLAADARTLGFGAGLWVVATAQVEPDGSHLIYTSPNATTWSLVSSNQHFPVSVCHGMNRFVAPASDGTILLSDNGDDWYNPWPAVPVLPEYLFNVDYANGKFIGLGYGTISFSDDGILWTNSASGILHDDRPVEFKCAAYGAGLYVAGGEYRMVWVSADGVTWTNPAPQLSQEPYVSEIWDILYTNGLFVAVGGYDGSILTSSNGLSWSARSLGNEDDPIYWYGLAYGAGRYVVVGSGYTAVSLNATNWSRFLSPDYDYLLDVAFGNGRFVAVGHDGIVTSADGSNWTRVLSAGAFRRVAFGGGHFVAMGGDDSFGDPSLAFFWTSQDGLQWERRPFQIARGLNGLTFGNGAFLTVGHRGVVLQSDPLVSLAVQLLSSPQLTISGPLGCTYRIECTDQPGSLAAWQNLGVVEPETMPFTFTDNTASHAARFYRAVIVPSSR